MAKTQAQFTVVLSSDLLNIDSKLSKAAEIIGGTAETHAKEHITDAVYSTPETWYIRTGNLRNRITHEMNKSGKNLEVIIGTSVHYAPYVEFGTGKYHKNGRKTPWKYLGSDGRWHVTSGMPARPYMRPALENHIKEYKDILIKELT